MNYLGSETPKFILYLQNKNVVIDDSQNKRVCFDGELEEIIGRSSNDWRKVCSIFSKIINGVLKQETTWQNYLKKCLLQDTGNERIIFSEQNILNQDQNSIHIIAGKNNFEMFGFVESEWKTVGKLEKIKHHKNIYYVPYFDYRQFPNRLVDEFIEILNAKVI